MLKIEACAALEKCVRKQPYFIHCVPVLHMPTHKICMDTLRPVAILSTLLDAAPFVIVETLCLSTSRHWCAEYVPPRGSKSSRSNKVLGWRESSQIIGAERTEDKIEQPRSGSEKDPTVVIVTERCQVNIWEARGSACYKYLTQL